MAIQSSHATLGDVPRYFMYLRSALQLVLPRLKAKHRKQVGLGSAASGVVLRRRLQLLLPPQVVMAFNARMREFDGQVVFRLVLLLDPRHRQLLDLSDAAEVAALQKCVSGRFSLGHIELQTPSSATSRVLCCRR